MLADEHGSAQTAAMPHHATNPVVTFWQMQRALRYEHQQCRPWRLGRWHRIDNDLKHNEQTRQTLLQFSDGVPQQMPRRWHSPGNFCRMLFLQFLK